MGSCTSHAGMLWAVTRSCQITSSQRGVRSALIWGRELCSSVNGGQRGAARQEARPETEQRARSKWRPEPGRTGNRRPSRGAWARLQNSWRGVGRRRREWVPGGVRSGVRGDCRILPCRWRGCPRRQETGRRRKPGLRVETHLILLLALRHKSYCLTLTSPLLLPSPPSRGSASVLRPHPEPFWLYTQAWAWPGDT